MPFNPVIESTRAWQIVARIGISHGRNHPEYQIALKRAKELEKELITSHLQFQQSFD